MKRFFTPTLAGALGLMIGGSASPVWAFDLGSASTPMAYAERGLTLKQGQLRLDIAPREFGLLYGGIGRLQFSPTVFPTGDTPGLRLFPEGGSATFFAMGVGAAYGVMDNLEAGVLLLPILMTPDGDFGDIETYGRFTLIDDEFSVGAQVTVAVPTNTEFGIGLGAPISYRFGQGKVESGAEFEFIFDPDNFQLDLDLPVAVSFQPQPALSFGVRMGLMLRDFQEASISIGGFVSYTIVENNAPFIDFVASLMWPHFIWTGFGDSVDLDAIDITVGLRLYFNVM